MLTFPLISSQSLPTGFDGTSIYSSTAVSVDVFHVCLDVLALAKAERESDDSSIVQNTNSGNSSETENTSSKRSKVSAYSRKSDYNSKMTKLIDKLTCTYNNTALTERYRVFPYVLSAVNKILSRVFPSANSTTAAAASPSFVSVDNDFSSSASTSKLILFVLICLHYCLKGLSEADLCSSLSNFDDTAYAIAATDNTDNTNNNDNDNNNNNNSDDNNNYDNNNNNSNKNTLNSNKSANKEGVPLHLFEQIFFLTDAITVFKNTETVMSKIVFLITNCMDDVKFRELENTKTLNNRSRVLIYDNNNNNKNKNNDNNSNINFSTILKKKLNADDDNIILECFSCLQLTQLYWKLLNISNNQVIEDEIDYSIHSDQKKKQNYLKPFSGFYLAQFIQYSLYFSNSK